MTVPDIKDIVDVINDINTVANIGNTADDSNDQETVADNEYITDGSNDQEHLADIEVTTDGRNEKETVADTEDTTDGSNNQETVAGIKDTTDGSNYHKNLADIEDTIYGRNEKETVADIEDTTDGRNEKETVAGIEDTTDGSNNQETVDGIEETTDGSNYHKNLADIKDPKDGSNCKYGTFSLQCHENKKVEQLADTLKNASDYGMKKRTTYEEKAPEPLVKTLFSLHKPDSFDTSIKFKELTDIKLQLQYQPEINHKYTINKQGTDLFPLINKLAATQIVDQNNIESAFNGISQKLTDFIQSSYDGITYIRQKVLVDVTWLHQEIYERAYAITRYLKFNRIIKISSILYEGLTVLLSEIFTMNHAQQTLLSVMILCYLRRENQSNLTDENITPPKKGRPSLILNVISSNVFRNAMDGIRYGMYELAYTRFFPNNCRMFIDIPINRFGFLGRSEKKGM